MISEEADEVVSNVLPEEWVVLNKWLKIQKIKEDFVGNDLLDILSKFDDKDIRIAIALSKNSSNKLLEKLKTDNYQEVRQAVKNRKLPDEWRYLDTKEILQKLQENDIPESVLKILSEHYDQSILKAVILHQGITESLVESIDKKSKELLLSKEVLKEEDFERIQFYLRLRTLPSKWKYLIDLEEGNTDEEQALIKTLKEDDLDDIIFEVFSFSNAPYIREAVASNPNISKTVLSKLRNDYSEEVLQAIKERSLPIEYKRLEVEKLIEKLSKETIDESILKILSESENHEIRAAVVNSPNTSDSLLEKMLENNYYFEWIREEALQRLLPNEYKNLSVEETINYIEKDKYDISTLKLISYSMEVEIRQAVARNHKTPKETLMKLLEDNCEVADLAEKELRDRGIKLYKD